MQHISDPNYTTILADPAHRKEWQAKINGTVYGEDSLINGSIRQINQLYGDALIGNACSGQLDLSLRKVNPGDIPRMAKVELEYRLINSTLQSAWVPKGTFWINTREEDPLMNTVTLHCVDAMMFGEQDFIPEDSNLPLWNNETMRTVANMCVQKINASTTGVNVVFDNPNDIQNTAPYILNAPPVGYTVRQILSGIAAAHGGNFIITPQNHLRFIPLIPTNTEVDIQTNVSNFTISKKYEAFGQVVFNFESDDGSTVSALYPDVDKPDGPVIETKMLGMTNSGYATTIAQNVYNTIKTYLYSPYKASDAILDPAMELGDGLTINGLYTVIAVLDETCDGLYSANIEAPSYEETDYEFVYQTKSDKNLERKLAKSTASMKIGIDSITQMVTGLAKPWISNTSYTVGEIVEHENKFYRCTVSNSDSTFDPNKWTEIDSGVVESILQLAVGKMTLSVSGSGSGSSIVLTSGSVRITSAETYFETDEAHFSGSLSANRISAGSIDADVVSVKDAFAVQMLIGNEWTTVGYVGAATGIDASGNTTHGAVLKSVNGNSYVIATNAGVRMQQGNTGFWIADNAISYRINGGSITPLGYAVFS